MLKTKKISKRIWVVLSILIGIALTIYGCQRKITVCPKKLPPAKVGEPYYQEIEIYATHPFFTIGPMVKPIITTNFEQNTDFEVVRKQYENSYGNIIYIKGTPTQKGKYNIHILTGFHGGGDLELDRDFTLIVE